MKMFSIIVAMDEAGGIGKAGALPWQLSDDLKRFKAITTATKGAGLNAVIMGRRTWDSLPADRRPLPGRRNVVLTRQNLLLPNGVLQFQGLSKALVTLASDPEIESIFVIGGGEIFQQALTDPGCERIYLTLLKGTFGCDAFFPRIPEKFRVSDQTPWKTHQNLTFSFVNYVL